MFDGMDPPEEINDIESLKKIYVAEEIQTKAQNQK